MGEGHFFQSKDQSSRKEGGIYMNNVNCSIVEDLLPLYMDGCCSKDSQQAVAEHMKTCEKP
mgnify:FL=1